MGNMLHVGAIIGCGVSCLAMGCGGDVIAHHLRSYEREGMVFDPVHYLPLLEKKINVLD